MSFQSVFDYRSPYAYLANTQLASLPVKPEFVSVDIVAVMKIVGNQPSPKCPAKSRYAGIDGARWARIYGVPMNPNRAVMKAMGEGQLEADLFCRAACAAQELDVFEQVHDALFSAYWGTPVDLVSEEGRTAFLRDNGVDADIWTRAGDDDIRARLLDNVNQAAENGVFGVPTFFVDEEIFFGNDRLEFVRDALTRSAGGAQ